MSVLVQRPHQVPGLISLPRQHVPSPRRVQPPRVVQQSATVQAAVLSPRVSRRQRGQSTAPKDSPAANTRSSKRRSNVNQQVAEPTITTDTPSTPASRPISSPVPSSGNLPISSSALATVSASQSSVLSASIPSPSPNPPRKANINSRSAPNTPTPANALPVPANRRRARSPRPTAKLPGLNLDEDSNDDATIGGAPTTPAAKRGRRTNAPGSIPLPTTGSPSPPTTWQQAALIKARTTLGALTTSSLAPLVDHSIATGVKGGSLSTPASPARSTPPSGTAFATIPNLASAPNFSTRVRRPAHARAPSVPAFPLDALFSSAMVLESPTAHKSSHSRGQSVSSSLPPATSLHARMMAAAAAAGPGRRERTLTGNNSPAGIKFAGASFQHAPDAMVLPLPGLKSGRFGMFSSSSSDESSSSSGEEQVVDLGADSADEDEVAFFN